jgi:large subunit ribosomal protein L11
VYGGLFCYNASTMAAKKEITRLIKLQIPAGKATPAPPIGTVLGPAGINISQFVNEFNTATRDQMGDVIPVLLSVYKDRTFSFIMRKPPASRMILKAIGKESGSGKVPLIKVGKITKAEIEKLAAIKMEDMNTKNMTAAISLMTGTARSMGVDVI